MLQVQRLVQRPRSFESLCGLNPTEFALLADQLEPLWIRAHRTSLLREGRQRRIGAGRHFKLDVAHRLLLSLIYLRHSLPMHLLGVLFEMDAANVCRNIHALLPLLEQALPAPGGAAPWTVARSRPTTRRRVVGCARSRMSSKRSQRSPTSSSTAPSSPALNPRKRRAISLGSKRSVGPRIRRSTSAERRGHTH